MDHVENKLREYREIFEEANDLIAVECIDKALNELYKYGSLVEIENAKKRAAVK